MGRDSGRLELWDAGKTDSRIAAQAHAVRIEHIAFGADDGIVLTTSVGSNMMGLDPDGAFLRKQRKAAESSRTD